jgi:CDP-diacylglycerol---glycerol-3-phosphate 3-phosphatidyltransferase
MGKSDRAFLFGLLGLLIGLRVPIAPAISWVLWAMTALLVVTIWNRTRRALQEVARNPAQS